MSSGLEREFALHLFANDLTPVVQEHKFHPDRRWRFDFAWPEQKIAAEIEGGVWTRGRHTRGKGFINDCDKYNAATLLGWRVFRFTREHIDSGDAIRLIEDALGV